MIDPMVFETLGRALRNTEPDARMAAVQQLEQIDDFGAVRMMLSHARGETEQSILQLIGSIAQRHDASECIDFLRRQLDSSDPEEKARLLFVAAFLEHTDVFTLAAEEFGTDDQDVTKAAFKILRRLGKAKVLKLLSHLARSKEPRCRSRAMVALAKFANAEVIPFLNNGLSDTEYEVRKAAYAGLQRLQQVGMAQACAIVEATAPPAPPGVAAAVVVEESPEKDEKRLTGLDKFKAEGKICRTCTQMKRRRPDGKRMHPTRLWCGLVGKETQGERTCPRGNWSK